MKKFIVTEKGKRIFTAGIFDMKLQYDPFPESFWRSKHINPQGAVNEGILEEVKEPELFGWDVEAKTLYKISGEDWTHEEHQLLVNAYNGEFKKIPLAIEWAHGVFRKWHTDDNDLTFADLLIK